MNTKLITEIKAAFIHGFGEEPIMVFSPGRINIIGEFTDYNEGYVFPAAIDKGIILAVQQSSTKNCKVIAVDKNEEHEFSLDNIKPLKNGGWKNYVLGVISEIQKTDKKLGCFNIAFGGDLPRGAGMSSSAALENSVIFGLNEVFDLNLSKNEMIIISQKAEHNYVGVKCGIMDQYASMFGQKNSALFLDCRTVKAIPFKIDFKAYQLLLINTNVKHNLSESAYNERRLVCKKIARLLNIKALRDATEHDLFKIKNEILDEDYQKALYVIQENERVIQASRAVTEDDVIALGKLLYASHQGLQTQFKVSCDELDFLVEQTRSNVHVIGARMMGGGFGGCTINLIAKKESEPFIAGISKAYKNKFKKECSFYFVELSNGTQLIK